MHTVVVRPGVRNDPRMTSNVHTGQWICEGCGFIYDEAEGDPQAGVAPGTPFAALPAAGDCPSCGGPRSAYTELGPDERIDPEH